jgi:lysozyme
MIDVKEQIKKDEGFNPHPYMDTTGHVTIGYGTNLEAGITPQQAEALMSLEIVMCTTQLSSYTWYLNQPKGVQAALINMCYDIGIWKLLGFKKMIIALINKDYKEAANEALDSKWAIQVGDRAKRIAAIIQEGK